MNRALFGLLALCASLLAGVFSFASAPPNAQEIVKRVQEVYSKHSCFTAHFNQLTVNVAMDIKDRFDGTMYVKRPSSIALDVDSPERQKIVLKGRSFMVYFPQDGNAARGEIPPEVDVSHFIGFFANIREIDQGFSIALPSKAVSESEHLYFLELSNKNNPKSTFRVVLGVDMNDFTIKTARIYDALGNYNRFDLTGIEFLDSIPEWRFEMQGEAGASSKPAEPDTTR